VRQDYFDCEENYDGILGKYGDNIGDKSRTKQGENYGENLSLLFFYSLAPLS